MKIYKMVIEDIKTMKRYIYESKHQGKCPNGFKLIAVVGYYEKGEHHA